MLVQRWMVWDERRMYWLCGRQIQSQARAWGVYQLCSWQVFGVRQCLHRHVCRVCSRLAQQRQQHSVLVVSSKLEILDRRLLRRRLSVQRWLVGHGQRVHRVTGRPCSSCRRPRSATPSRSTMCVLKPMATPVTLWCHPQPSLVRLHLTLPCLAYHPGTWLASSESTTHRLNSPSSR